MAGDMADQPGDRTGRAGRSGAGRSGGWRLVAYGLLGGVAWGVAARGWMRYISDNPEFSWSGTLLILGWAALAGTAFAGVELLRRRGARLWRLLVAVPALGMFASPGVLMAPTAVMWGLAVTGRGGRWVRLPAALLGLVPPVAMVAAEGGPSAFPHSPVLSLAGYLLLCGGLALGWSTVWRRRVPGVAGPGAPVGVGASAAVPAAVGAPV